MYYCDLTVLPILGGYNNIVIATVDINCNMFTKFARIYFNSEFILLQQPVC